MSNNPIPLVVGTNGHVAAIDPATGDELWRTQLQTGLLTSTRFQDVAVVVHENTVYAGSHGNIFALSLDDGSILWSNSLKGLGYNDISLAIPGISVQFAQRKEQTNDSTAGT